MSIQTQDQVRYAPAGAHRDGGESLMIWGKIPLATKVSTRDTDGALYAFQHTDMARGGPPLEA